MTALYKIFLGGPSESPRKTTGGIEKITSHGYTSSSKQRKLVFILHSYYHECSYELQWPAFLCKNAWINGASTRTMHAVFLLCRNLFALSKPYEVLIFLIQISTSMRSNQLTKNKCNRTRVGRAACAWLSGFENLRLHRFLSVKTVENYSGLDL